MELQDKGRDLVRQGYTISFNTQITFSLLSLFHKTLSVSHWPAIFCYIFLLLCLLDLGVGFLLVVGVWKMGFKAWLLMDSWVWMCVGVLMFVFWLGFWGCILMENCSNYNDPNSNNPKNLQLQPKITLHKSLMENRSNYNDPNSNNSKLEDDLSEIETGSLMEKQIDTILFNELTLSWFLSLRESSKSINTRRSSILYRSFQDRKSVV